MGGSCSKYCTSVIIPERSTFDQIQTSTTTSISVKSTRIIENCIIIWLFDDPSNKYETEKKRLSQLFYGFQIFTNPDACIHYIREITDEKVFLIISVTYQSLQYMCDLPQLEKVYVFDPFVKYDKKQLCQNNTFHDIHCLSKQVQNDIELCELDLLSFSVISNPLHDMKSPIDLTKEEASFIFIQLSKEILARLKFESVAKDVFIEFCQRYYINNPEQFSTINEFVKYYRPNLALDWLRRPCFISKIMNRVKRTREIDLIYKLGFFSKHINMQLIRLHEETKLQLEDISTVYRGRTMLNEEFDNVFKNKCDDLLSFSNFLIATTSKEYTIDFIQRRLAIHSDMIGILFEIHIEHTMFNEESPFSLLKENNTKNREICFSVGTVFRIQSIEQFTHNSLTMHSVKLQLIQNDDPQLKHVLKPFRTSEMHENPLSCLGKLLMNMGEYRRTEQFFLEMLNDTSIRSQPRRLVRARIGLGANYLHIGEYATALEHYEQALLVSLTYLSSDHYDLAPIYKSIGDCYLYLNDYRNALEHYDRSLNLIENNVKFSKTHIIDELWNLINQTKELMEKSQ